MIWTPEYLNSLALEAEIRIAEECPCIIDRISIQVDRGRAEYQLPEYVANIRSVTWKGIHLDPEAQLLYPDWIYTLDTAISGTFEFDTFTDAFETGSVIVGNPQGKPERYFYSTFGENKIVLHPTPNEDIPIYSDPWNADISSAAIVEFYRVPDGTNFILPKYIRRRTIKAYVLWKAFSREGDGQNLKAAKYWETKYTILLARAKLIVGRVNQPQIRSRNDMFEYQTGRIARPKLPWNWQTVPAEDDYD